MKRTAACIALALGLLAAETTAHAAAGQRCAAAREEARAQRGSAADAGDLTRSELRVLACAIGEQTGIDPELFEALVWAESAFQIDAVSPVGAQGLTQLMPSTAAELGIAAEAVFDPLVNLRGGAIYLAGLLAETGSVEHALAGYNAGPARAGRPYARLPRETRAYVAKIMRRAGYAADDSDLAAAMNPDTPSPMVAATPGWVGGIASMTRQEPSDENPS